MLKTLVHEYLFQLYHQPGVVDPERIPGDLLLIRESIVGCGVPLLWIKTIMGVPKEPPVLIVTFFYEEPEGFRVDGTLHVTARDRPSRIDGFGLELKGCDRNPMLKERIIGAFEDWLSKEVEEFIGDGEEENDA